MHASDKENTIKSLVVAVHFCLCRTRINRQRKQGHDLELKKTCIVRGKNTGSGYREGQEIHVNYNTSVREFIRYRASIAVATRTRSTTSTGLLVYQQRLCLHGGDFRLLYLVYGSALLHNIISGRTISGCR